MSQRAISSRELYNALVAEGFTFPDRCVNVSVEMPPNGPLMLTFQCHVPTDKIAKIAAALERIAKNHQERPTEP